MKCLPALGAFLLFAMIANVASAQVYINEFCADPFYNTGVIGLDTNLDGVLATSAAQSNDEFVEIVNLGPFAVNIGGWTLSDTVTVRHVFASGTILPAGAAIVVFGGGSATNFNLLGAGFGVVASTGQLGLNNANDSITLVDPLNNLTIDGYTYGSAGSPDNGDGEAVTRNPELPGSPMQKYSLFNPAIKHTAGYYNDGITPYLPAILPTATYPGNLSDISITTAFNGTVDNQLTNVHTVPNTTTYVSLSFKSPSGTLTGQPFLAASVLIATGFPPIPITLPGDNLPAVWLTPLSQVTILIDGFSTLGLPFSPILGPNPGYVATGAIPPSIFGVGFSILVQAFVPDPARNAVGLGVSDAHELIFP